MLEDWDFWKTINIELIINNSIMNKKELLNYYYSLGHIHLTEVHGKDSEGKVKEDHSNTNLQHPSPHD